MSRRGLALLTALGVSLLLIPPRHATAFVWNASASAPLGLYRLSSKPAALGDLVLVNPPPGIADFAAKRHYLPRHVPLIKHLAAREGDTVCARGHAVLINGQVRARRWDLDRAGRPMPRWFGCRHLRSDQVFLLNGAAPYSYDGRYFGPVPVTAIVAVLSPLWTR